MDRQFIRKGLKYKVLEEIMRVNQNSSEIQLRQSLQMHLQRTACVHPMRIHTALVICQDQPVADDKLIETRANISSNPLFR